jgi:hypothetical protein
MTRDCTGNPRQPYEAADTACVTRCSCGNTASAKVSANDRLRNTGCGYVLPRSWPPDLPLPFGEHGSCVRPSRAAGIVGLAARLVRANEVCSAVLIFAAAAPPRRQTGPRCRPLRSVSAMTRPKDPIR